MANIANAYDTPDSGGDTVRDKRELIRIGMDSVLIDVILNYVSLGIDTMYF